MTWVPDGGIGGGHPVPGRLCSEGQRRPALRPARRRRGLPGAGRRRRRPHPGPPGLAARPGAAWSTYDGRLTLAVPGTAFTADRVLEVLGRLAEAVGAPPSRSRRCSASAATAAGPARLATVTREIALLTNPTAGKGRAPGRATLPCRGCAPPGFVVRDLVGRDADEALDLARQCVADGVEALVVVRRRRHGPPRGPGGRRHRHPARHHPGRHRQRRRPLPRHPAQGPARGRRPWSIAGHDAAPSTWPAAAAKYFVTVLAAGFDAVVNERANRMTWPKGQMRYNLATLAELRTFKPMPYTLDLDGRTASARRDAGRGRQRAVVRRRAADHRGRPPRRRPARRGHHQADEQGRAWSAPTRSCSRAPTSTHPQYEHHRVRQVTVAAPGIVAYADGERFGALPLTIECVPGALTVLA